MRNSSRARNNAILANSDVEMSAEAARLNEQPKGVVFLVAACHRAQTQHFLPGTRTATQLSVKNAVILIISRSLRVPEAAHLDGVWRLV
jgi:hypothetical protein